MRRLILPALIVLALSGCGEDFPVPKEGTITALPYGGESFWYTPACGQYRAVVKTRQKSSGTGKNSRTWTESYSEQQCVQNIQIAHRKAPWWQVCVKRPKGPDYCTNISENAWRFYKIGDHWSS